MKVSLFLSVTGMTSNADYVARQSVCACASIKLAANITPYYSCLQGGKGYYAEAGCRIDLLSVPENRLDDIIYLWNRLSDILDTGCLHIEISNLLDISYQGCICKWPHYRVNYGLVHDELVTCADGSWHSLDLMDHAIKTKYGLSDQRPRYGKPLC